MDVLLLLRQRRPSPQLLKDVVEPRQSEILVRLKHLLPMRVELLGEIADGLPLLLGSVRKWEGIEAAGLTVAWIVAYAEACSCGQGPSDVHV